MPRRRSLPRRPPLLGALASALVAATAPATAPAQPTVRASGDVGAAMIRQHGDTNAVVAPTAGGELDVRGRRLAARATLTSTLAAGNRWSAQGDLTVTRFAGSLVSPWEIGVVGSALRFRQASFGATHLSVYARRHLDRLTWGAWTGGGGGWLGRRYWDAPVVALEGGAWTRRGRLALSLALVAQRARLDSSPAYDFGYPSIGTGGGGAAPVPPPLPNVPGPVGPPLVGLATASFPIETLLATDATMLASWRGPRLELSASLITRYAPAQAPGLLGSALGSAAWWAHPTVALTASAGTTADDPLRNVPASRFATVGLRWRPASSGIGRARPAQPGAPAPTLPEPTTARSAADVVVRDGDRVLRVLAPGATRVEVRADATEWRPVALAPDGRHWTLPVRVAPGTQRLLVRIDGGEWTVPANLPTIDDEFGTRVGLLVVP